MQDENITPGKIGLIKLWNQKEVDFRLMYAFKNQLYASPLLSPENRIPVSEFVRLRSQHDHYSIRNRLSGTEDIIIQEIQDPDTGLLDLNQFSDLVDLFMFLPNTEKVND